GAGPGAAAGGAARATARASRVALSFSRSASSRAPRTLKTALSISFSTDQESSRSCPQVSPSTTATMFSRCACGTFDPAILVRSPSGRPATSERRPPSCAMLASFNNRSTSVCCSLPCNSPITPSPAGAAASAGRAYGPALPVWRIRRLARPSLLKPSWVHGDRKRFHPRELPLGHLDDRFMGEPADRRGVLARRLPRLPLPPGQSGNRLADRAEGFGVL